MATKRKFTNGFLNLDNEESKDNIKQNEVKSEEVNLIRKEDTVSQNSISKENQEVLQNESESITEEHPKVEQVETQTKTEIVNSKPVETVTIQKPISISEYVEQQLIVAEKRIDLFYNKTTGFGITMKKPKFSDMYAGITMSMNRDINEIIEYLANNSTFTKTQIIEILLVEGLKNVKFE